MAARAEPELAGELVALAEATKGAPLAERLPARVDMQFLAVLLPLTLALLIALAPARGRALEVTLVAAAVIASHFLSLRDARLTTLAAVLTYVLVEDHYGRLDRASYWRHVLTVLAIVGSCVANAYQRHRLARSEQGLEDAQAEVDELRGGSELGSMVPGRRGSSGLATEVARARRHNHLVTVVLVKPDDLDDSERNRQGATEHIVDQVANVIGEHVRASDVVFNCSAETFCLVLPETDATGGRVLSERIRLAVRECRLEFAPGELVDLSVSIGIASFPGDAETNDELEEAARRALQSAAESGNRTVLYSVPSGAPGGWGLRTSDVGVGAAAG